MTFIRDKLLPLLGEQNVPGGAVKDLIAQLLLQLGDLLGEAGLGDVRQVCRFGKAHLLCGAHHI